MELRGGGKQQSKTANAKKGVGIAISPHLMPPPDTYLARCDSAADEHFMRNYVALIQPDYQADAGQ